VRAVVESLREVSLNDADMSAASSEWRERVHREREIVLTQRCFVSA
jgi:hypothetical protein